MFSFVDLNNINIWNYSNYFIYVVAILIYSLVTYFSNYMMIDKDPVYKKLGSLYLKLRAVCEKDVTNLDAKFQYMKTKDDYDNYYGDRVYYLIVLVIIAFMFIRGVNRELVFNNHLIFDNYNYVLTALLIMPTIFILVSKNLKKDFIYNYLNGFYILWFMSIYIVLNQWYPLFGSNIYLSFGLFVVTFFALNRMFYRLIGGILRWIAKKYLISS